MIKHNVSAAENKSVQMPDQSEQQNKRVTLIYEDRLLVFVDILGWKNACQNPENADLKGALSIIHEYATDHNEAYRRRLISSTATVVTELGATPAMRVNPMFLQVQFAAFSDHFVFSKPASFGPRILEIGNICRRLLSLGFLTRGAVVRGPLHHVDNLIFGPALVKAAEMESSEAIFPRILIDDSAIDAFQEFGYGIDPLKFPILDDQLGRKIINIFHLSNFKNNEMTRSFIEHNMPIRNISNIIESNLARDNHRLTQRQKEKWKYLKDLLEQTVFPMYPMLKDAAYDRT